jgi:hypothetical protein
MRNLVVIATGRPTSPFNRWTTSVRPSRGLYGRTPDQHRQVGWPKSGRAETGIRRRTEAPERGVEAVGGAVLGLHAPPARIGELAPSHFADILPVYFWPAAGGC